MANEMAGIRGDDLRTAQMLAAIYNSAETVKRSGGGQFSVKDFLPEYWQVREYVDPDELIRLKLGMWAGAMTRKTPDG